MTGELLHQVERRGVRVSDGLQLLSVEALLTRPFDPGMALLIAPTGAEALEDSAETAGGRSPPFEPPVLPGREAHGNDATALLRALYPEDHPALALDGRPDTHVGELTESALTDGPWLLPALTGERNVASPHALPWLVARLRAPDGCPWDREQTHLSLRKFLLEESYEVYDALEEGSTPKLAEELGDLLLQVVLHAHYAAEDGVFDLSDVYRDVMTKIVRRHPHVFGDVVADTAAQVIRNWELIKADERAARGDVSEERREASEGMPAAFQGLSRSLPALAYSQEIQERAASLGYDWPEIAPVLDKIEEELEELRVANDADKRREEFGDVLLVVVNLGRKMGIDAEAALRAANAKFARRFAEVERLAATRDVRLSDLSFEALDDLWREAKSSV